MKAYDMYCNCLLVYMFYMFYKIFKNIYLFLEACTYFALASDKCLLINCQFHLLIQNKTN